MKTAFVKEPSVISVDETNHLLLEKGDIFSSDACMWNLWF